MAVKRFYFFSNYTGCDPDAIAYLDAEGVSDSNDRNAICIAVKRLKEDGLWVKMNAFYPFMGLTSKYNLINPLNSDAAHRIDWSGGVTFSSDGVKGNGINAYGNTHKIVDPDKGGLSVFVVNGVAEASDAMGARNVNQTVISFIGARWTDNKFYSRVHSASSGSVDNITSLGFYANSRLSDSGSNSFVMNLRGVNTFFSINKSSVVNNVNQYILNSNVHGAPHPTRYSTATLGCATIHEGMTASDLIVLEDIVKELQTNLGRI